MNPAIEFHRVQKSFGSQPVLRDFSLSVEQGAFLTVIGRSGCGKTTALRLVNALIAPDGGRVLVKGRDAAQADPAALRRGIGYTIQNVGLFPHMTVEKNIAYVPALSKSPLWKGEERRRRAAAQSIRAVRYHPRRKKNRKIRRSSGPSQRFCFNAGWKAVFFRRQAHMAYCSRRGLGSGGLKIKSVSAKQI